MNYLETAVDIAREAGALLPTISSGASDSS